MFYKLHFTFNASDDILKTVKTNLWVDLLELRSSIWLPCAKLAEYFCLPLLLEVEKSVWRLVCGLAMYRKPLTDILGYYETIEFNS